MRPLLGIAGVALFCMWPSSARAGLVFELDGIDARRIDSAEVRADRVTVTSRGHAYVIEVPGGAGPALLAWARSDRGGPLVFSMDGSMVPPENHDYRPPSVPAELARLLFQYDGYAHSIACGATPWREPETHPLVQSAGGEGRLPHRMHQALLDPAARTPQAYSYRRLTERYADPPECIGELSLYARPGTGGRIVSIQPRSWVHIRGWQWYREIDVPSEADAWVARLPYQPLKQDMEARWPAYRAALPPLGSLSSIVEAMAVLRAIKRDAPAVWRALEREELPRWLSVHAEIERPRYHRLDSEPWRRLARAWIGDRVDTPAQANLLLGLLIAGDPEVWSLEGLEAVAARDPRTEAKYQLAVLLGKRDERGFVEQGRRFFERLAQEPHSFRLRAQALFAIEARAARRESSESVELAAFLESQRAALVNDFLTRARAACASSATALTTWEGLSQDVYSVGLLRHLRREGALSQPIVEAVACIHFNRGMAVQPARQLAYRHAHYRFLGYLARHADPQLRSRILEYRRKLASSMNLSDWDLEDQV